MSARPPQPHRISSSSSSPARTVITLSASQYTHTHTQTAVGRHHRHTNIRTNAYTSIGKDIHTYISTHPPNPKSQIPNMIGYKHTFTQGLQSFLKHGHPQPHNTSLADIPKILSLLLSLSLSLFFSLQHKLKSAHKKNT